MNLPKGSVDVVCRARDYIKCNFGVTVVDSDGVEQFRGATNCNGVCRFNVEKCDTYRLSVFSYGCLNPAIAYRWVLLDPCLDYEFMFIFMRAIENEDVYEI